MAEEIGPVTPAGASPEGASASSSEATGDVLYLGVDLGTANSSIATSTDITRTVPSVVGCPRTLWHINSCKSLLFMEKSASGTG
jgi:hypothetical protein